MLWDTPLGKLRGKCRSDVDKRSAPPAYENCSLPDQWRSPTTSDIKPTDTPQWKWTAVQCKAWLYTVLTVSMDYDPAKAEATAAKLDGFGPNIYSRDKDSWVDLLGYQDGNGLYLMLLSIRKKKGAIPRNIKIMDGYPSERKAKERRENMKR